MQHAGAFDAAVLQILQGLVGFFQVVHPDFSFEVGLSRKFEELAAVLARAVGDAANGSLMIEQLVIHLRDCAHSDAGEGQRSSFAKSF